MAAAVPGKADATEMTAVFEAELIFPLHDQHNHAPAIVECPNGDLLVSWYRGSGECEADDVAIYGARRRGATRWSEPFLMTDTPGFPDGNTAMYIDARGRLWLFWPTILANSWESCVTRYRRSSRYETDGPPVWEWQDVILLKPRNFEQKMLQGIERRLRLRGADEQDESRLRARAEQLRSQISDKLASRLGWQPRCKPTVLPSGRILLPLYTDTYSVSIMAISDDGGESWYASEPLAGFGSIQPTVLRREDGTLVAWMRENGPLKRIRVAESRDEGLSWGPVGVSDLPNPGAGIDGLRLTSGKWLLVYDDTTRGRSSLAVSLSDDEGRTWKWTRHLERHDQGAFHYPAVIQAADGRIHVVYSYFVKAGKSIKHAVFNEAWVVGGDRALR